MVAIFNAITAFAVLGIIGTFTGSIIGCIGACCDKSNDVSNEYNKLNVCERLACARVKLRGSQIKSKTKRKKTNNEKQALFHSLKTSFSLRKPKTWNVSDWSLEIPALTHDSQSEARL